MRKHFNTFLVATTISRAIGYIRDLMIAHFIGGGYWADIYYGSFRLANFFRRLVGEGGLYAAYTPLYSKLLIKDKDRANHFAQSYGILLAGVLTVAVAIGLFFIGPLARILLPGFAKDPEKLAYAVSLSRVLLPFLLFISIAAWSQATLQANGKFFLSSLSPAFAAIPIILFLFFTHHTSPANLIYGMAIATTIGAIAQWLIQMPQLARTVPFSRDTMFSMHEDIKKSLLLFGPYILTFSIDQVNNFIDIFFGTFAETGAITALNNSYRLIQLPIGLIGVGSLVSSLPALSQMASRNEKAGMQLELAAQKKKILLFTAPAALIFMVFAKPIIGLLYHHGRFSDEAFAITVNTLIFSAPSLLFYSLQKIYLAIFYAHHDTRSPMINSMIQMIINVIGCATLVKTMGVAGIALTSSVASLVGLILLSAIVHKKGYLRTTSSS